MAREQDFQPDWVSAPGETIADLLQERGLPPAVFAQRIGCAPEDVNELLRGRALLTAETARLLEAHLGASIRFWLNRESQYRFHLARLPLPLRGCAYRILRFAAITAWRMRPVKPRSMPITMRSRVRIASPIARFRAGPLS